MNTNSQFSLANRKQLADVLGSHYGGLREKAKSTLRTKRETLFEKLKDEQVEKSGAPKIAAQIKALKVKIDEFDAGLAKLGFSFDGDDLCFYSKTGARIRQSIEEQLDKELGTTQGLDTRFDEAQFDVMTAATFAEARQIMKSVSEK